MLGNVRLIELTQGRVALVSAEDYNYLMRWKWHYSRHHGKDGYAERSRTSNKSDPNCSSKRMHRVIAQRMGFTCGVDHADQYKLNCQRYNLRPATTSQNNSNRGLLQTNTSGYNGVCESDNRWRAYISLHNSNLWLKKFPLTGAGKIQAAYAHDVAAARVLGADYAWLNPGVADLIDEATKREIETDTLARVSRRLEKTREGWVKTASAGKGQKPNLQDDIFVVGAENRVCIV